MNNLTIRELQITDKKTFLAAMQKSQLLHHPWVKAPLTPQEFDKYLQRSQQPNQKSFLLCLDENIVGVFNINEIVQGYFQSAYLGFYVVQDYAEKGYMQLGLKLILHKVFDEMGLHRLEANIQPENHRSIELVKKNRFRYEGYSPRYLKVNDQWCGHERWAITREDFIRDNEDVLKKDHIHLEGYDPEWPNKANIEINRLRATLPSSEIVDIQHVGSTAIPGVSAKPIIDIQIAARNLDVMKIIAVPILQKMGYEYWAENPDSERMFFAKGMPPYGKIRTHHVHIVEPTSKHWKEKILFRDYLLTHPDIATEYQELKIKLAKQHMYDREEYTNAKGEFVKKVLELDRKNKI